MDIKELDQKLDAILAASKDMLTTDEAANYIGISKGYLYKLMAKRKIPFSKPNNKLAFFDKKKLNQWLRQNPQKTKAEIEAEATDFIHLNLKN